MHKKEQNRFNEKSSIRQRFSVEIYNKVIKIAVNRLDDLFQLVSMIQSSSVYCSISNDCLLCDDIREVLERKFQKIRMFRRCLVRRCPIEAQKSINRTLHDFEYDTACIIRSSSSEFRESFFV